MACYILNETVGRVSNIEIVEHLFSGQNTTSGISVSDTRNDRDGANLVNHEDVSVVWHAKNKYYEADILVYVSSDLVSDNCRVPPIGAIIYYTDKVSSLPDCNVENGKMDFICSLDRWLNSHTLKGSLAGNQNIDLKVLIDEDDPESEDVRLIVVESFLADDTKSATLKWALDKGVEVIDLSEKDENDENSENECTEIDKVNMTGIGKRRVLEALQTYPWHEIENDARNDDDKDPKQKDGADSNQVSSGGDFEDLMSKLSTFKQASDNLPRNERYAFAEQIALSFYSAMAGEEEEPESSEQ